MLNIQLNQFHRFFSIKLDFQFTVWLFLRRSKEKKLSFSCIKGDFICSHLIWWIFKITIYCLSKEFTQLLKLKYYLETGAIINVNIKEKRTRYRTLRYSNSNLTSVRLGLNPFIERNCFLFLK